MKNPAIKVLSFDLDDTLWHVDSVLHGAEKDVSNWLEQHCPAVLEKYDAIALRHLRMEVYQQQPELQHQISQLRIEAMRQAMVNSGINSTEAASLAEQAFEVFIEARHQVNYFDEVENTLAELKQAYTLGVLTNGNANVYRLGLGQYFEFAFSTSV